MSSCVFRLSLTSTCSTPSASVTLPTMLLCCCRQQGAGPEQTTDTRVDPFCWLPLRPPSHQLLWLVGALTSQAPQLPLLSNSSRSGSSATRCGAPAIKTLSPPVMSSMASLLLCVTEGLVIGPHAGRASLLVDKAAIVSIGRSCWVGQNPAASCLRLRLRKTQLGQSGTCSAWVDVGDPSRQQEAEPWEWGHVLVGGGQSWDRRPVPPDFLWCHY